MELIRKVVNALFEQDKYGDWIRTPYLVYTFREDGLVTSVDSYTFVLQECPCPPGGAKLTDNLTQALPRHVPDFHPDEASRLDVYLRHLSGAIEKVEFESAAHFTPEKRRTVTWGESARTIVPREEAVEIFGEPFLSELEALMARETQGASFLLGTRDNLSVSLVEKERTVVSEPKQAQRPKL